MKMYCYKRCSTCKKAEQFMKDNQVDVTIIDYTEHPLSEAALLKYYERSGQDIQKFFNTSGLVYRDLHLKDKLPKLDLKEKIKLLAEQPMLVKRPLLVTDDAVLLGFNESVWRERLGFSQ